MTTPIDDPRASTTSTPSGAAPPTPETAVPRRVPVSLTIACMCAVHALIYGFVLIARGNFEHGPLLVIGGALWLYYAGVYGDAVPAAEVDQPAKAVAIAVPAADDDQPPKRPAASSPPAIIMLSRAHLEHLKTGASLALDGGIMLTVVSESRTDGVVATLN